MDSKNRFDRLSKRRPASSPPPLIIAPTDVVVERIARRGRQRRRRQRQLWLLGVSLWMIATIGFVIFRAWQAQHKPSSPKRGNRPTSFPVRVGDAALQQVKNVRAVWVRHEEQGGQPCDLYEVRGKIVNPKSVADTIAPEVTMRLGKTNLYSETIVEEVEAGEEKMFALPIRDFTAARDRQPDNIYFLFSVSRED